MLQTEKDSPWCLRDTNKTEVLTTRNHGPNTMVWFFNPCSDFMFQLSVRLMYVCMVWSGSRQNPAEEITKLSKNKFALL